MTVSSDIDRVIGRLQRDAGMTSVEADDWLEDRRETWDGKTPLDLIESGRTDEVLAEIALIPQRS